MKKIIIALGVLLTLITLGFGTHGLFIATSLFGVSLGVYVLTWLISFLILALYTKDFKRANELMHKTFVKIVIGFDDEE